MFQNVRKWIASGVAALGIVAGLGAQVAAPVVQTAAVAVQSVGGTAAVVAAATVALSAADLFAAEEGTTGSFTLDAPVNMDAVTDSVSDYIGTSMGKVIALAVGIFLAWKVVTYLKRAT